MRWYRMHAQSYRDFLRQRAERTRKDWIENYPLELKPMALKVQEARDTAVKAITRKHRLQSAPGVDPQILKEIIEAVEEIKETCRSLEIELENALLGYRLKQFGADKQGRVKEIYVEQRRAIMELRQDRKAEGEFFRIAMLYEKALSAGDQAELDRLGPLVDDAQRQNDEAVAKSSNRIAEIQAERDRRLEDLRKK